MAAGNVVITLRVMILYTLELTAERRLASGDRLRGRREGCRSRWRRLAGCSARPERLITRSVMATLEASEKTFSGRVAPKKDVALCGCTGLPVLHV